MNLKSLGIKVGKLFLCGIAFSVGIIIGGLVTSMMELQQPSMPEGLNPESAMLFLLLESPLLALVLVLLARHLSGGF